MDFGPNDLTHQTALINHPIHIFGQLWPTRVIKTCILTLLRYTILTYIGLIPPISIYNTIQYPIDLFKFVFTGFSFKILFHIKFFDN